jgi:predicted DNA-binding protein
MVANMSETLTVRLGAELAQALRQESQQTGLPRGEIARQALELRLRGTKKLSVLARYSGIMSGPPDLSSNKAYRRTWRKKLA